MRRGGLWPIHPIEPETFAGQRAFFINKCWKFKPRFGSLHGLMPNIKPAFRTALSLAVLFCAAGAQAGEADIHLPPLQDVSLLDGEVSSQAILFMGLAICVVGAAFGF